MLSEFRVDLIRWKTTLKTESVRKNEFVSLLRDFL